MPKLRDYSDFELATLRYKLAKRWLDPVARAEDIFRVRTALGKTIPLKIPEPQKEILRQGPLGEGRKIIDAGLVGKTVLNKGRQIGYSTIAAVESILMAEDFPNTDIYYIADDFDQAKDFMDKVTQLCKDANHFPYHLGKGPILTIQSLEKVYSKTINNTEIIGLSGRTKGKRGKSSVYVIWDEMAWCISLKDEQEEIWDVIQYYLRQGGWLRMQSTPRTTDDKFWNFYSNPEDNGMKAYYRPVIENWKELDLKQPLYFDIDSERRKMKQLPVLEDEKIKLLIDAYSQNERYDVDLVNNEIRQKNILIPYSWVKLEELEKMRAEDLEKFMQENLGVSVDEKYKLIHTEWIYRNIAEEREKEDRGESKNPFYMLIDLAQVNDITAITIVEKMPDETIIERRLESSQDKYDVQIEKIWSLYQSFKVQNISIDNTGHGRVIGDELEKRLRQNGLPLSILNRVDFTSSSKETMAVGFKRLVQADKYKFLNQTELHAESIRHVERVEKEVLSTHIRYSGKRWGRDDFFWSKAQIVWFTNLLIVQPDAAFGKIKQEALGIGVNFKAPENKYEEIKEDIKQQVSLREISKIKSIAKALNEFEIGSIDCPKTQKDEKQLFCTGCKRINCMEYNNMKKICDLVNIEPIDVWKKQKKYEQNEHSKYPE